MFSPSSRKHYLNVTLDNIVRVYPPVQSDNASSTRNLIVSALNIINYEIKTV